MASWGFLLLLFITLWNAQAHNILVIITLPGKSHGILGDGLIRHLLKGGHEVTFITPYPPKSQKNLTIIDVSENSKVLAGGILNIQNMMKGEVDLQSALLIMELGIEIGRTTLANPEVQELLSDRNQKFDLIITEWLSQDLYAGFAAVFDCPYIWFSSFDPHWMVLRLIDEMPNPAYVSDFSSNNSPPLSFQERVEELVNQIYGLWSHYFYIVPLENKYYETYLVPHIRNKNKPVPSLYELKYNASLMFGNSHVSFGMATRLPQNYISIGGYHIETDVKPLPNDLQKIMDNAEHGVIYFSMGSNLRSEDLPETLTRGILKIFGKLKQTVIWKFESDLPNRPKNVHIVHWAPQQSILAHPKILFFISHGGILSTTESVHFAVPMICIPVMVDQFANVDRAVQKGFAIKVDLSYTMDKDLEEAIHTMLRDPKYAVKAKELSFVYHDRIASPGNEILHWVDHVVKTRGGLHLRSPALHVPWYQKLYLDLFAVILVLLMAIIFISKRVLSIVFNKIKYKTKTN